VLFGIVGGRAMGLYTFAWQSISQRSEDLLDCTALAIHMLIVVRFLFSASLFSYGLDQVFSATTCRRMGFPGG